jgi:hypothetical protein
MGAHTPATIGQTALSRTSSFLMFCTAC